MYQTARVKNKKRGELEDHVGGVAALLGDAIDLEPEVDVLGILELALGDVLAHRAEGVIALGSRPWKSSLLCHILIHHNENESVSLQAISKEKGKGKGKERKKERPGDSWQSCPGQGNSHRRVNTHPPA